MAPSSRPGKTHAPDRTGIIDCFAGVGGFAHALLDPRFGLQLALTVEVDRDARHMYRQAFPQHDGYVANIRELTWVHADGRPASGADLADWEAAGMPDGAYQEADSEQIRAAVRARGVDPATIGVVAGGFPCTTFAKCGAQAGVRDKVRGTLFSDVIRLAEAVRPDHILLENVPNLAGARHREWFTTIIARIRAAGYAIADTELFLSPDRLAPELGGTPQVRRRLFFAARRIAAPGCGTEQQLSDGLDLDALGELFDWDPARWDPLDICDPDESFDTTPYLLSARERAWITAWDDLLSALEPDDLPTELYVDTFTRTWTPAQGTDPAARRRMERSHAFYQDNRAVIDAWMQRTWDIDGVATPASAFPKTRRILEWQARSAQPTRSTRDLWATTFSFRSSGIRVKPLTTLPALVALNTTSAIGPRGRFITPREALRLQGHPVPVWEPPTPAATVSRAPRPALDDCAPWTQLLAVPAVDPAAVAEAAQEVTDAWWERGGWCDTAVHAAVRAADECGASPGEILLAAAALASRQPRWRGSGLRWTELAWDAYRGLGAGSPVVHDLAFAAVDWRVRRRAALAVVRAATPAGVDLADEEAMSGWLARHVDLRLPASGESWQDRAADIAVAARAFGIDPAWARAMHRSALLARWDEVAFPLTGLAELDAHLERCGIVTVQPRRPAGTSASALAAYHAGQAATAARLDVPAPGVASRNAGAGMPATALPLTGEQLAAGCGRLAQLDDAIATSTRRLARLQATGDDDPRTRQVQVEAMREYVHVAHDLRRHRSSHGHLRRAADIAAALALAERRHAGRGSTPADGHDAALWPVSTFPDAALALNAAWAQHLLSAPFGPMPVTVLPLHPVGDQAPAWLDGPEPASMLDRADQVVAVLADDCGVGGMVIAAHYERERSRLAHIAALREAGVVDDTGADQLAVAAGLAVSVDDVARGAWLASAWVLHHAAAGTQVSWDTLVCGAAPEPAPAVGSREPAPRVQDRSVRPRHVTPQIPTKERSAR